ncbi:MAG: glutamate-1-semialdehyde-2,1-aminomutase [Myxococcales bacterium]|nr:glutamate-1-semialdehyde-2,1-aminomutase [Myxococcales bacterium]
MSRATDRSDALFAAAETLMPGGVNSPVRAFRSVGGNPPFIASAEGAYITDADGNRYVDYCGTWGPAILGHAHHEVVEAVCEAAQRGMSFGAPSEAEVDMARAVRGLYPSIEMMRMVSSGTEACMSAIRLARGFTGRDGIVKFEGCYHGHADSLLVKAGSGGATFGVPDSAGVPADLARHTYTVPFNDVDGLRSLLEAKGTDLSCVILEAVTGNMGVIRPSDEFLAFLATVSETYGTLVIFDEVMTGFRVAVGGAQGLFEFKPDLTCLGKVVGGGLPVGVYGGRAEVMASISPLGPVYQAGTLSGNPLATAAGLKTIDVLSRPGVFDRAEHAATQLANGLRVLIDELGIEAVVEQVGTMMTLFFAKAAPTNFAEVARCDHDKFGRFHRAMLDGGIYLPPSGYEAWFVSAAHTDAEVQATLNIARSALLS